MDAFTKFVNLYPVKDQRADTIADVIFHQYMPEHGVITQLHTDQGGSFDAKLVREVCESLQIRKTRTTGYHPQSNWLIERFNRTVIAMIAKHTEEHPDDWDKQLGFVAMTYNSVDHDSTGYTPFFLSRGREMQLPVDLMITVDAPNHLPHNSATSYARNLKKVLHDAFEVANKNLDGARKRQKHGYDKWAKEHACSVGTRVWLLDPTVRKGRANKTVLPWVGPYIVKKRFDDRGDIGVTYRIKLEGGKRRLVVHCDRLKPCFGTRSATDERSGNYQGQDARSREVPERRAEVTVHPDGRPEATVDTGPTETADIRMPIPTRCTEQRTHSGRQIHIPCRYEQFEL